MGYSQGSAVGTWAVNVEPDYYAKKLKLFVALAPTVMFSHCKEPSLITAANNKHFGSTVLSMGFLEFNGKDRYKPDELKEYLWKEYVFLCAADPDACNFKVGL